MKLTKTVCDKAVYKGKGKKGFYALWDGQLRGFGLRITPSGTKSFIVFYRTGGKQRIITIGRFGVLTVDQARKRAQEILVEANQGGDPAEEKKKAHKSTFAGLADDYLQNHSRIHKKSWREDQRRLNAYLLPAFGARRIVDISRAEVVNFHRKLGKEKPYEANRVISLLSALFEYARKNEYIAWDCVNPARLITKFRERSRAVFMKKEDLPKLFAVLDREANPYFKAFIKLTLYTAARKTELLTSKWGDVDWDQKVLRLKDSKNGQPYEIRLSESALAILRELPRQAGNDYIFPSETELGKRLWNVDKPWRRVRAAAGLDHVNVHDLRRTSASWLAQAGVPLQHISGALNHKDRKTTEVYARLCDDPIRDTVNRLDEIIGENIVLFTEIREKKTDTA
ncbi:MAG: tyrosine-type recombinase/integrase [Candidatus Omnitrophica bacterium]|nr:tyrosine-type recombinase/integrase [Candidatus Omnitrophota bacterium]